MSAIPFGEDDQPGHYIATLPVRFGGHPIPSRLEPSGLDRSDGKQPDGIQP